MALKYFQYRSALDAADAWVEVWNEDQVRDGTLSLTELAEHLQVGTSTIVLDDPDADLGHDGSTILAHHRFELIEPTATDQHVVITFIGQRKFTRGDTDRPSLRVESQRQIELSLFDLNAIPSFRVIQGEDEEADRPAETVSERLTWLLDSSYLTNHIKDGGLIDANSTLMDANNYQGQTAANVINDCELAAGFGWNAWVYYDESLPGQYNLGFLNANTSTSYSSSLRITNNLADVDTVTVADFETGTTFAAAYDTELTKDPANLISGVDMPYADGTVYRVRHATADIYGPREQTAPNTNVKNAATAERMARDYLFQHSTDSDNIHTSIEVPTSKVNSIRAGHRIQVKFTHLPGYEGWTWCRVIRRTVIQEQATDRYILDLDLSPQEEAGPAAPSIVQSVFKRISAGDSMTFPNPVTIGNLLVFCIADRNFSDPTPPNVDDGQPHWGTDPWTALPDITAGQRDDGVKIYYKTADTTESVGWVGATDATCGIYEISGADISSATAVSKDEQAANVTMNIGSLGSPVTGSVNIMVGLYFDEKHTSDSTYPTVTGATGWTIDKFGPAAFAGIIEWDAPLMWIGHSFGDGNPQAAQVTRSGLLNRTGEWGGAAISIPPA